MTKFMVGDTVRATVEGVVLDYMAPIDQPGYIRIQVGDGWGKFVALVPGGSPCELIDRPAPQPEPVCECGHGRDEHTATGPVSNCRVGSDSPRLADECTCLIYRPATPEPATDLCECGHEWSAHSPGADSTTCCASYSPTICTAYRPVSQDAKPAESGNPCECGHGLEVHGLASHHGSRCFSAGCLCTAYRPATPEPATDLCHCGDEVLADDTGATRGMCAHCDPFRCDVDPGNCGRCTSPQPEPTGLVERVVDAAIRFANDEGTAADIALAVADWLADLPYDANGAAAAVLIRREVEGDTDDFAAYCPLHELYRFDGGCTCGREVEGSGTDA